MKTGDAHYTQVYYFVSSQSPFVHCRHELKAFIISKNNSQESATVQHIAVNV